MLLNRTEEGFYASSTGLRDVNTGQKVIISNDRKLIDVKTGKKY